jgi:hypothetical protein
MQFVDYWKSLAFSFVVVFMLLIIFIIIQVNHQDQLNLHQFNNLYLTFNSCNHFNILSHPFNLLYHLIYPYQSLTSHSFDFIQLISSYQPI